jgi:hypothetical protein
MNNLLRSKYHLIYGALAQCSIIVVNLVILITNKYNIDDTSLYYDIATLIIPNFFYTAFIILFYYIYWKKVVILRLSNERFNKILFSTLIIANLLYYVITILNSGIGLYILNGITSLTNLFLKTGFKLYDISTSTTNGLYYINTTIIQVINTFFASSYILSYAKSITTGKEHVVIKMLIYSAVIASLLSLYFCFDNIFMTWAFLVLSAILLFITYTIYHNHFKRNIRRRSVKK